MNAYEKLKPKMIQFKAPICMAVATLQLIIKTKEITSKEILMTKKSKQILLMILAAILR